MALFSPQTLCGESEEFGCSGGLFFIARLEGSTFDKNMDTTGEGRRSFPFFPFPCCCSLLDHSESPCTELVLCQLLGDGDGLLWVNPDRQRSATQQPAHSPCLAQWDGVRGKED